MRKTDIGMAAIILAAGIVPASIALAEDYQPDHDIHQGEEQLVTKSMLKQQERSIDVVQDRNHKGTIAFARATRKFPAFCVQAVLPSPGLELIGESGGLRNAQVMSNEDGVSSL